MCFVIVGGEELFVFHLKRGGDRSFHRSIVYSIPWSIHPSTDIHARPTYVPDVRDNDGGAHADETPGVEPAGDAHARGSREQRGVVGHAVVEGVCVCTYICVRVLC